MMYYREVVIRWVDYDVGVDDISYSLVRYFDGLGVYCSGTHISKAVNLLSNRKDVVVCYRDGSILKEVVDVIAAREEKK